MVEFVSISRRRFLWAGSVAVVGAWAGVNNAAAAGPLTRRRVGHEEFVPPELRGHRDSLAADVSENGWPVEDRMNGGGRIWTRSVEGSSLELGLRIGDVEDVLMHVVRRFHYEVMFLEPGDMRAYVEPSGRDRLGHESNHSSGTAVCIYPSRYPVGVAGGLYPLEVAVVRDILADCEGVVAWGGDFPKRLVHEAHFQIDVGPGSEKLAKVADKVRRYRRRPGTGAGPVYDPQEPGRLRRARSLERAVRG